MADSGTCGFCGFGDGRLGDQGDESTQLLHAAIRVGKPGEWSYGKHPNALEPHKQSVVWCGHCVSGLAHKFQRLDDHNLNAEFMAMSFWLELDGPRWGAWEARTEDDRAAAKKYQDDVAVHMDKLNRQRRLDDLQNEKFRRAGFDLTTRGWRP